MISSIVIHVDPDSVIWYGYLLMILSILSLKFIHLPSPIRAPWPVRPSPERTRPWKKPQTNPMVLITSVPMGLHHFQTPWIWVEKSSDSMLKRRMSMRGEIWDQVIPSPNIISAQRNTGLVLELFTLERHNGRQINIQGMELSHIISIYHFIILYWDCNPIHNPVITCHALF